MVKITTFNDRPVRHVRYMPDGTVILKLYEPRPNRRARHLRVSRAQWLAGRGIYLLESHATPWAQDLGRGSGNSPRIALKHYCMVTDHDFDRARGMAAAAVNTQSSIEVSAPAGRGTESGTVGAQNAAQRLHAAAREDSHDPRANPSATATSTKSRDVSRNPCETNERRGRDSNPRSSF